VAVGQVAEHLQQVVGDLVGEELLVEVGQGIQAGLLGPLGRSSSNSRDAGTRPACSTTSPAS
jgi:hypothetical protein